MVPTSLIYIDGSFGFTKEVWKEVLIALQLPGQYYRVNRWWPKNLEWVADIAGTSTMHSWLNTSSERPTEK